MLTLMACGRKEIPEVTETDAMETTETGTMETVSGTEEEKYSCRNLFAGNGGRGDSFPYKRAEALPVRCLIQHDEPIELQSEIIHGAIWTMGKRQVWWHAASILWTKGRAVRKK